MAPRDAVGALEAWIGRFSAEAAKLFLDPYAIEYDDRDSAGELRFNAIGMVRAIRDLHNERRGLEPEWAN